MVVAKSGTLLLAENELVSDERINLGEARFSTPGNACGSRLYDYAPQIFGSETILMGCLAQIPLLSTLTHLHLPNL
jgi:hypothetical protein